MSHETNMLLHGRQQEDRPSSHSIHPSFWRVFCAVEVPEEVGLLAVDHIRKLQQEFPDVSASWNRQGKFHLTLKFLGNISQDDTSNVSRAAKRASESISPFQISFGGTGVFPKHGPPSVLWLGVEDGTGKLSQLQVRLEDECSHFDFPREQRPFHPHLTLARLRKSQGAKQLAEAHKKIGFVAKKVTISELLVMRSELNKDGSKHSVISRHPLGTPQSQNCP